MFALDWVSVEVIYFIKMKLFLQLIVLVTVTLINIGDGAPAKKSSRQDVVVPAVIPAVVTAAPGK